MDHSTSDDCAWHSSHDAAYPPARTDYRAPHCSAAIPGGHRHSGWPSVGLGGGDADIPDVDCGSSSLIVDTD